ncbi:MAG: WXG100 family type VII secretion target [Lachnospiraceae bacterium]|nr:WXG100 family type VII secretion target [Lachnospiraceae bacterium]
MASKEIANDLERFAADIEAYNTALSGAESEHDGVFSDINSLNSMWTGNAHDTFMNQFNADSDTMKEMLKLLKQFGTDLENAKKEYTQCEQSVEEIISAIKV